EDLVLGLVDGAERARAQLLDDLVASGDLGRLGGGRLQAHGYPLARRPAEAAAPDQVQVDVVDAVSRIVTGVEDQPEAPLVQAQVGGQVAGASHQAPHEGVVAGSQVALDAGGSWPSWRSSSARSSRMLRAFWPKSSRPSRERDRTLTFVRPPSRRMRMVTSSLKRQTFV